MKSSSATKHTSYSSSVEDSASIPLWLQRRYDWTTKQASYKLTPHDFVPPADDQDSYVLFADFTEEIVDEMEQEKEAEALKDLYATCDVILQGTDWQFAENEANGSLVIINTNDIPTEIEEKDISYILTGSEWSVLKKNNMTFLKKMNL